MSKISPCLWFDGDAEDAARFYVTLLPDSRIDGVHTTPVDTPSVTAGGVLVVSFTLAGQTFLAMNGGPGRPHGQAISLMITCDTQAEIDRLWAAILDGGGQEVQCGWILDRWGVNWQVTPSFMPALISDPERGARAMRAMFEMVKLDIDALRNA